MNVREMKRLAAWPALAVALALGWPAGRAAEGRGEVKEAPPVKMNTTADHSQFKELQQTFKSGPGGHQGLPHLPYRGRQAGASHQALDLGVPQSREQAALGKKNVLNNFCISIESRTTPFCTSCHVGYGWKDKDFDFTSRKMSIAWPATTRPATTRRRRGKPGTRS